MKRGLMHNKKGLSAVVTAIIMIVLVLIAVGIVWSVVSNIVEEGTGQISISSTCLEINVKATKAICAEGICDVTLTRTSGGAVIGGLKLIFSDASRETTHVEDISGDMAPLETKTVRGIDTGLIDTNKVEVTVYLIDESEKEQLCPQSTSYEF